MNQDTREISSITFGVYSPEEIRRLSVAEIDKTTLTGGPGTVYDDRLGAIDNSKTCETCHQDAKMCQGHFGHIELNEPIIHPLYYKKVLEYLRCFCIKCNRLLIIKDQIMIDGINRFKGQKRFQKILEKLEKVDECCQDDCGHPQPEFKYTASEQSMAMVYKEKGGAKTSVILTVDEIKKTFDNVSDEDVELLGFDPKLVHPRNFILVVFPVIPPCARPYVLADGNTCDDDLTNQILEIIKSNNNLNKDLDPKISETKRQKSIQSLKFRILTFYNNSQGKAKHATSRRPIKGLKERMTGKEGQIRNNLMGKRCEQTARTVAGGDPTLKLGQLGVPFEIAEILTVPVQVASFNIDKLTKLVNNNGANFVIKNNAKKSRINLKYALFRKGTELLYGDVIYRGDQEIIVESGKEKLEEGDRVKRGEDFLPDVRPIQKKNYRLELGDIVERKLQSGDYVLLNRQPTLHKASMQAMEVKLMPHKTFRVNLAITKPFNMDFDKLCRKQAA